MNFTVAPYSAVVKWAAFYGTNSKQSIGFGGLPSGTSGQGWFDLSPQFVDNRQWATNQQFLNMTVNYSGTGGTNGSNPNSFNLVACNVGSSSVGLTSNILTPYSVGLSSSVQYGIGAPICAAWFPQGDMVTIASTPQNGVTPTAGQKNGSSFSFAGTGATQGMTMSYQFQGTGTVYDNTVVSVSTTPGSGPFLTQNAQGQWAVVNIPTFPAASGGVLNLLLGNTPGSPIVASYDFP